MTTGEICAKLNAYCHKGVATWRWCEEWLEFHDGNWIDDDINVLNRFEGEAVAEKYERSNTGSEAAGKMTNNDSA